MTPARHIIIVGSGLGGLAAAIRLRAAGCAVTILERNSTPGGKLQEHRWNGYRWDMGPSLLTMPHVLRELFSVTGKNLDEVLKLERLDSVCRYFWSDGTRIDENEAFWQQPEVARFLDYARGIYELSAEAYLHHPPEQFWRAFSWRNLSRLRHLPSVMTFQTLAQKVDAFFLDPHLRQLFYRFATYNGSSPYLTPATFNIIPYVEAHFGGWYPHGGLRQVAESLIGLARKLGVVIETEAEVVGYDKGSVRTADGREWKVDAVICNQDALAARATWLRRHESESSQAKLLKPELSCSGLVILAAVHKTFPQLQHHNLFFGSDYPAEFASIFQSKTLPSDPTIYVANTSFTDSADAPEGCCNLFILVNAPSRDSLSASFAKESGAVEKIFQYLEAQGLTGLREATEHTHVFAPAEFARRDASHQGSLYGWASHSIGTSVLRPSLRHPHLPEVFFTGGTTHPGGGIPLVLLSGKMVAEMLLTQKS